MKHSLQIQRDAISRTAEETLCCANPSRLSTLFLLLQESLRLINPYLNKFLCPEQAVEQKRPCCLHCCKTQPGLAAQICSFLTVSCHLSAQARAQLIPTKLWLFQIPPSTSCLPPHLDKQQTICCSRCPWRNKAAGTWMRCLTHGEMHYINPWH